MKGDFWFIVCHDCPDKSSPNSPFTECSFDDDKENIEEFKEQHSGHRIEVVLQ
jgi:hypothetical protein